MKYGDKKFKMRHSCEHILTQAMLKLYPKILMAMGPATESGFYFDFDPAPSGTGQAPQVSEKDFPRIEAEMAKIINADLPIAKKEISISEARKLFKGNPYKQEWVDEIEKRGEKPTVYWTGREFVDLCAGPHVKSAGEIGPFKLLSVAGAYWHGDEKNKMLTRIYGTCFLAQKELDRYLWQQEEAKKRDHRIIGKNLNLFVFSDLVGKGLPLFTEKGSIIRRELERFIVDEETKRGYHHVYTPDLANVALFKKSGHYPYYKDTMYPVMKIDDEELILRPMTCPHHFQLYLSQQRSYKDLPLRFAELAKQFRYEKSGELTGLLRVRAFCLADAHIICRKDQAVDEINGALDLIEFCTSAFGLKKGENFRYRLSLGDRNDSKKFYQDDKAWDFAEDVLRKVLFSRNSPSFEAKGEAAFYGPKVDIQMTNFAGIENTAFTVQYDFVMPKRFELTYVDMDGSKKEAVVIHRSSIGALERLMAFLIEHYAGSFPVWLSPVQAIIIPITDRNIKYGRGAEGKLKEAGIRVELDDRSETLSAKIRDAQLQKIPYMLIMGDREEKAKTVSKRGRSGKDYGQIKLDQFIANIKKEIEEKTLE